MPHATRRRDLAEGETLTERLVVNVPESGYYRFVVTASVPSNSPGIHRGYPVQNSRHLEGWLWINDVDGRYTVEFEPDVFPQDAYPGQGPLRMRFGETPQSSMASPQTYSFASTSSAGSSGIQFLLKFYNNDTETFDPVPSAHYTIQVCTVPQQQFICEEQDWVTVASGATNSQGFTGMIDCDGDEYRGWMNPSNGKISIPSGSSAIVMGSITSDCGETIETQMGSGTARVFTNMVASWDGSVALLGVQRSQLKVSLGTSDGSWYSPGDDEVTIGTDAVWTQWGVFVTAHELGHAVHEKALAGNVAGGSCPNPHFLDGAHSLKCAFSEGFADFHGVATRSDLTTFAMRSHIANNAFWPGCTYSGDECIDPGQEDGSIIEGPVATFLYHMVDGLQYPGSYIAAVMESCEVRQGSSWLRANGVDHLTYCFEDQVDSAVTGSGTYFPTRSTDPNDQRSTASKPGGWAAGDVRGLWTEILYGEF